MLKNNKGITLIALVITIIVLLILAGVSIAMLTGDNGILTQATSARDDTKEAEAADKINMALNGEYANLLADGKMSGGADVDEDSIADANGISKDEFTIVADATKVGSDKTGDVLTITSKTYGTVTGKITNANGKYTIKKATYPGESTKNSTNET